MKILLPDICCGPHPSRTSEYPFSFATLCTFNTYMVMTSVTVNHEFKLRNKNYMGIYTFTYSIISITRVVIL
jgi:hypothetical protein